VALYFSASWCKPCREFTPKLVELYNKKKAEGEDFEVRPLFRSHGCGVFDGCQTVGRAAIFTGSIFRVS
jgi:thiol-disulfide isomerase/thioredoxin